MSSGREWRPSLRLVPAAELVWQVATTKVHLGLPLAFEVTEGQRHDIVPAPGLVNRTRPKCLLGDKAYSTHDFRDHLDAIGCQPVIPSSSSWIDPPAYDVELYKARSDVECTFSLLKARPRQACPTPGRLAPGALPPPPNKTVRPGR